MKTKSICFVCRHGLGRSPGEARELSSHLSSKGAKGIFVYVTGISTQTGSYYDTGDRTKNITNSNIVVGLDEINITHVKPFSPKGDFFRMNDLLIEHGDSRPAVYDFLMNLAQA